MREHLAVFGFPTVALAGLVWGFFVDVSPAERFVGQAVCLTVTVAFVALVLVRREQPTREKRPARPRGTPMSIDEQWAGFFLLVGTIAALALGEGHPRWTQLTIVMPLCMVVVLVLDEWSRRYRRRRDERARSES